MILIYCGKENALHDKIEKDFGELDVRWITSSMYDRKLGELIDPESKLDFSFHESMDEREPFIYFAGMDIKDVNALIDRMEQAGLSVTNRAVETKNNVDMTLLEELTEVAQESQYFEKRDRLLDYVIHADRERMNRDDDYFKCVSLAAMLLQEADLSPRVLDQALQIMESFNG